MHPKSPPRNPWNFATHILPCSQVWRHHRQLPSDDDWQETKEYVDAIKHGAEVMQEPRSKRELAAIHLQGHTEAKVFGIEENKKIEELQKGKDTS